MSDTTFLIPRTPVYLLLGSNIEPEKNLTEAVNYLRRNTDILALSSVYQTPPQGDSDQADFLNLALKIKTMFPIEDFQTEVIAVIEQRLGRQRDPNNKNAPRTIDIDILLWGELTETYGEKPWRVPHPDIIQYAHAAVPLAEIAPDVVHPETKQPISTIAALFDSSGFKIRADLKLKAD